MEKDMFNIRLMLNIQLLLLFPITRARYHPIVSAHIVINRRGMKSRHAVALFRKRIKAAIKQHHSAITVILKSVEST
jgi:hypothetical protein